MTDLPADFMQIPPRLNIADAVVTRHVREGRGDRPALHCGDDTVTYAELDAMVNRSGNALTELGLGMGDRFAIRADNSLGYAAALLGGMKIGAVPIPSSTLFRAWEVEHTITNSEVAVVLTTAEHAAVVDEVAPSCPRLREVVMLEGPASGGRRSFPELCASQPAELDAADTAADDPAYAIYTSGTSGKPKGIEHAHRVIIGAAHPVVYGYLQLEPDECLLIPLELSWMFTIDFSLLFPLYAGARGALYRGRFDVNSFFEQVARLRVTRLIGAPTMFRRLLSIPDVERLYDLSSVKMACVGGEPLPEDTHRQVKERFGFGISEMFGQTEAHVSLGNPPDRPPRVGSMGLPLPGRRAAVLDEEGTELAVGETGHLCFPADEPALALGYRNMDEEWARAHRAGWFYSGDLAYRDADGYFWYVSRADDVIKSRGYRISPGEVEAAAMEHPAVLEAAVVGVPDDTVGQRITAFLVLHDEHEPSDELTAEIMGVIRSLIAPYKVPKDIEIVSELPKTVTGKILRRALRQRAIDQPAEEA
ncbi:MAG: acyl-CoA synthetase [Actinomycetota bacterium]|nr:acyl-CoA synthetase [Actinomycetota bacterium]